PLCCVVRREWSPSRGCRLRWRFPGVTFVPAADIERGPASPEVPLRPMSRVCVRFRAARPLTTAVTTNGCSSRLVQGYEPDALCTSEAGALTQARDNEGAPQGPRSFFRGGNADAGERV